jgi:hypothetical protein
VILVRRLECDGGWTSHAFSRRGAAIERDRHRGVCRGLPKLDSTSSEFLLCRKRHAGCGWLIRFRWWQLREANQKRDLHEQFCIYR